MAGLFVNAEEVWLAKQQLNYDGGGVDLVLHAYSNDYTPVDGSTLSNFTECAFLGYTSITLTGASWTITADAPTSATYSTQTFSSTADQTASYIYGIYVTRNDVDVVYAERFSDGPYAIVGSTDYFEYAANFYYKKAGE